MSKYLEGIDLDSVDTSQEAIDALILKTLCLSGWPLETQKEVQVTLAALREKLNDSGTT